MRDAYVREAEGDMSRAILVACIDMATLKAYVQDIEALAIQHGASLEETMTARPVALDTPERPRLIAGRDPSIRHPFPAPAR